LITEAQHRIEDRVAAQIVRLERATRFQLLHARQKMDSVPMDRTERRMTTMLHRLSQRLDEFGFRMEASVSGLVRTRQREVGELAADVLHHDPRQMLARARERLNTSRIRLERSLERTLRRTGAQLGAFEARLRSLSPLAVLDRGYALVLGADDTVIRSIEQVAEGDRVRTRLSNGEFVSTVEDVTTKK
jgi:exodeoxyribonuclease VII large subunit